MLDQLRYVDKKIFEQKLVEYFKENDDEELLTMKSSEGKTLINVSWKNSFSDFLCLVVEKYPNIVNVWF